MQLRTLTYTEEELTIMVNNCRENYLQHMQIEGIITQEQLDRMAKYSIVITPKDFFGSVWDRLFKKGSELMVFTVKVLNKTDDEAKVEQKQ